MNGAGNVGGAIQVLAATVKQKHAVSSHSSARALLGLVMDDGSVGACSGNRVKRQSLEVGLFAPESLQPLSSIALTYYSRRRRGFHVNVILNVIIGSGDQFGLKPSEKVAHRGSIPHVTRSKPGLFRPILDGLGSSDGGREKLNQGVLFIAALLFWRRAYLVRMEGLDNSPVA